MHKNRTAEPHAKPIRWPLWRRLLIGLVAFLLLAGAYSYWKATEVQRRIEAFRAAGIPMSIAELAPTLNAAEADASDVLAGNRAILDQASRDYASMIDTPFYDNVWRALESGATPSAEDTARLQEWVDAHAEAYALIDRVIACDRYSPLLLYDATPEEFFESLIDSFDDARNIARLIDVRCDAACCEQDWDTAGEAVLAGLEFSRLIESLPLMIGNLTEVAINGIARENARQLLITKDLPEGLSNEVDAQLARLDNHKRAIEVLEEERAYTLDNLAWQVPWPFSRMWRGEFLDWYDEQLTVVDQPWCDGIASMRAIDTGTKSWFGGGALIGLLEPAATDFYRVHNHTIAKARSLRVLLAIRRNSLSPGDTITTESLGLSELVLTDPFIGERLVIDHREASDTHSAGWWVYSVGENGVDEGGVFDGRLDAGVGPFKKAVR